MTKAIRSVFAVLVAVVMLFTGCFIQASAADANIIDNSSLLPQWAPTTEADVDENGSPKWLDSLVMMGCRIATATPEGTFQSAVKVLDHCAEMGVNGLWITPVHDYHLNSHGYYCLGPQTIDPRVTGIIGYDEPWRETDYDEGFKVYKNFVDEAHKRNIRVIMDVVSWGIIECDLISWDLTKVHPDWFQNGNGIGGEGSKNWIYDNEEAREWFATEVAKVVEKTGVDGIRWDMEPNKFGYGVAKMVREKLLEKGIRIASISEGPNERGELTYDLDQWGINGIVGTPSTFPNNAFIDGYNIVESVKTGKLIGSTYSQAMDAGGEYKYYTNMLSCHDFYDYYIERDKIKFGYQAIYAPFIPLWFIGEQWNNSHIPFHTATGTTSRGGSSLLFGSSINWEELDEPENRAFYEEVKRMIRIRRTYPEIFNYFPDNHRNSNICDVEVIGQDNLYSYARYAGNKGLLIVPNDNAHKKDAEYKVYIPFADMELDYYESYTVKNLATGKVVAEGTAKQLRSFTTSVAYGNVDVFEVTANGERNLPETETPDEDDEDIIDTEDGDDEDLTDTDGELDEDEDEESKKVVIKHRRKKKNNKGNFPWGWVIGGSVAAVLLIAGAVIWIILYKKRKKNQTPAEQ